MPTLQRQGLARHTFQPISLVGLVVALSAQAGGGPDADQSAPGPPSPRHEEAAPAGQSPDLSEVYTARKQYLNNFLVRDRDFRVLLLTAVTALDEGDERQAAEALQAIWDAPEDVLVWDDTRQRPQSVWQRADQLMLQIDAVERDAYQRRYGTTAEQLLDAVTTDHDRAAGRELLRRFRHTRAAGRYLELKALQAMDRGELEEAAALWKQLLDDPWQHTTLDMPRSTRAFSLCEQLEAVSGRSARDSQTIAKEHPPVGPTPGTARVCSGNRLEHRCAVPATVEFDQSLVSPPISDPLWTCSFLEQAESEQESIRLVGGSAGVDVVDALTAVVGEWSSRQQADRNPLGATGAAVTTGELVVVRDFTGVTARHVRSGEVVWRYECKTSFLRALTNRAGSGELAVEANPQRLSSADLFSRLVADHSVLSTLTTDGERVYLIDGICSGDSYGPLDESGAESLTQGRVGPALRNELIAVSLHGPEQGHCRWSRGGRAEAPESGLRDFYFLGPPEAHNESLYVIGEQNEQLQVVVLDAATGTTQWKQPISLVDLPLSESETRSRTACSPVVSQGVVVCPTQLPVLVGLDATTGTLLWVYHAESEERPDSTTWNDHGRRSESDDRPMQPVIIGPRMLFLPPDSTTLHCIDVRSGGRLWWADARAADYVACADETRVVLVSSQECFSLSLQNGDLLWRTPINAPAGRGVVAGEHYVVPLNSGRIVEINIADGTVRPDLPTPHCDNPSAISVLEDPTSANVCRRLPTGFSGNLAIYDDLVVCCSSAGVSVFQQSRSVLDELVSGGPNESSPADALRRAELHIRLSEWNAAIDELHSLLAAHPPDSIYDRGVEDLRELLYLRIAENPPSRLRELADLVSTPAQKARYLLYRLQFELDTGQVEAAARTACRVQELQLSKPIRMDCAGRHFVLPSEFARFSLEEFVATAVRKQVESLRSALEADLGVAGEIDFEHLAGAVALLNAVSAGERLSIRLAEQLQQAGRLQAAEALVLNGPCREFRAAAPGRVNPSRRRQVAAHSTVSGTETDQSAVHSAVPTSEVEHLVLYRPQHHRTSGLFAQFDEPETFPTVEIREQEYVSPSTGTVPGPGAEVAEVLDGRSHFLNAGGTALRLIDRSQGTAGDGVGRFAVFASDGITELGEIETPPARWRIPEPVRYRAGHLVPLLGKGVLMLSLLERRVMWNAPPNSASDPGPCLGPYGPDFCVLQSGQELTVVDAVTGDPLWRRSDLKYQAGLSSGEELGVIGDGQVLVVFDADRTNYEMYHTRSGHPLRQGTLPGCGTVAGRRKDSFGRRFLYEADIEGTPHVCIWDPLADCLLMDCRVDGRWQWCSDYQEQYLTLLNGRSLKLIDATTGRCEWELDVDSEDLDHVRGVHRFRAGDVDLVLLDRHLRDSGSSPAGLDIRVPSDEWSGDLYAVDHGSGTPIWAAPLPVPPARVLLLPQFRLPFLIALTRTRDSQDMEEYRLKVDVIDIDTGCIIGSRSDLTNFPILQATCDARNHQLTLWGPDRRVDVMYSLLRTSRH